MRGIFIHIKTDPKKFINTSRSPQRPPCPKCGGNHISSNGVLWICCGCGKQWTKHKTVRIWPTNIPGNPSCPGCNGNYVVGNGTSWMCRGCGKQWKKVRRIK